MVSTQETQDLVKKFGADVKNSGKTEVQIAVITARIASLSKHLEGHKLDMHSKRGLMQMIGKRRRLLKYLSSRDDARYQALLKDLGLRK